MKRALLLLLSVFALAAAPISTASSADDVLDALDARGKDLNTLVADIRMTDSDPSTGDVADTRTGHIFYQVSPSGDARFRAVFDKKITGHKIEDAKHEWVYSSGKLVERDYTKQTQQTRQILKPDEKIQLFNLEGPFPLPLGQDKADVHKHFDVQKLPPDADDPKGSIHLQLTPHPGTDLAKKFKTIDIWFDPATNMPARITVLDGDGNDQKQTDLSNVHVNGPIKDADLQLQQIDLNKNWNVADE